MINLAEFQIVAKLPDLLSPGSGQPLPDGIIGSQIIAMGTTPKGYGLIIDYKPPDGDSICRVQLEFDGREMWVAGSVVLEQEQSAATYQWSAVSFRPGTQYITTPPLGVFLNSSDLLIPADCKSPMEACRPIIEAGEAEAVVARPRGREFI